MCALVTSPAEYTEKWAPENWIATSTRYIEEIKGLSKAERLAKLHIYQVKDQCGDIVVPAEQHQAALQIAYVLKENLKLKYDRYGKYLFEGSDWMDPGEPVDVSAYVCHLSGLAE